MLKGTTKFQLLQDEFKHACNELKLRDEMIKDLRKEVEHWKKCAESEQNIASRLQKKVENLQRELELIKNQIELMEHTWSPIEI